MELQKFIDDNHSDYLNKFKKTNLFVKKHSQLGLALLRLNKNIDYDFKEYTWLRYCKGAIINLETNKLVCIPPEKSAGIIDDDSVKDPPKPKTSWRTLLVSTVTFELILVFLLVVFPGDI